MRRSLLPWLLLLSAGPLGCGAAPGLVDEAEADAVDADASEGWVDAPKHVIPKVRASDDPEACLVAVDLGRAYVLRARDAAIAVGALDRERCLARHARTLSTVRHLVAAERSDDAPIAFEVPRACAVALDAIAEARTCE